MSDLSSKILLAALAVLIAAGGVYIILFGTDPLPLLGTIPLPAPTPVEAPPPSNNLIPTPGAVPVAGAKILEVEFPIKAGHQLYYEFDASIVPRGRVFDRLNGTGDLVPIKNVEELAAIVDTIRTREQAFAFVRFFTDYPTSFFLASAPFSGIEPEDSPIEILPSMSRFLSAPRVEQRGKQWVIERDLLLYPGENTLARLVRAQETISADGTYSFSVKKVLLDGREVDNALPYYE